MLYPFLTLPDGTEVVYSSITDYDGFDHTRVKFERWNDKRDDFDSMECELPNGKMEKVVGFSPTEADYHHSRMMLLQTMIMECAREDTEAEYAYSN